MPLTSRSEGLKRGGKMTWQALSDRPNNRGRQCTYLRGSAPPPAASVCRVTVPARRRLVFRRCRHALPIVATSQSATWPRHPLHTNPRLARAHLARRELAPPPAHAPCPCPAAFSISAMPSSASGWHPQSHYFVNSEHVSDRNFFGVRWKPPTSASGDLPPAPRPVVVPVVVLMRLGGVTLRLALRLA
jgi:hypothetical protein